MSTRHMLAYLILAALVVATGLLVLLKRRRLRAERQLRRGRRPPQS